SQVEAKGQRVSMLAEQVNQARIRADTLTTGLQQAQADMIAADVRMASMRQVLREQAIDTYVHGPRTPRYVNPALAAFDVAVQTTYVASVADTQADALDQVRASKVALDDRRSRFLTAKKAADGALKAVATSQKA